MTTRIWTGLLLGLLLSLTQTGFAEEIQLEEMTVGPQTYKKVIVTSRSKDKFIIMHSSGMATIRVSELDSDTRVKLGYQPITPATNLLAGTVLSQLPIDPEVVQAREKMVQQFGERIKDGGKQIAVIAVAVAAFLYLFGCYCCKLICEKAGYKPKLLVWVPGLQFLALLKAAGMPGWWFLLSLAPLATPFLVPTSTENPSLNTLLIALIPSAISMIVYIVWSFKICKARGIGSWAGIFLLLPVTNLLTFLYLAFGAASNKIMVVANNTPRETFSKSRAQDTSFFMSS